MTFYTVQIQRAVGCTEREAAMVEAYMRCEVGTLDRLDRATFAGLAGACFKEVQTDPAAALDCAQSFGLLPR